MTTVVPRVVRYGNLDRWVIMKQEGSFWTGLDFGSNPLVYANLQKAIKGLHHLLKEKSGGEPKKYVVPLLIEVYGDVDIAEVALHLSETVEFSTNLNGPYESIILPAIHWQKIKEIS